MVLAMIWISYNKVNNGALNMLPQASATEPVLVKSVILLLILGFLLDCWQAKIDT